jgi:hypothetical protein
MKIRGRIFDLREEYIIGISLKGLQEIFGEEYQEWIHIHKDNLNFPWEFGDVLDIEISPIGDKWTIDSFAPVKYSEKEIKLQEEMLIRIREDFYKDEP